MPGIKKKGKSIDFHKKSYQQFHTGGGTGAPKLWDMGKIPSQSYGIWVKKVWDMGKVPLNEKQGSRIKREYNG